jgi:hypothetical protein
MLTVAKQPEAVKRPLVIWRLLDGKPGHENQTLGLLRALERLAAERGQAAPQCIELFVADQRFSLWSFVLRRFHLGKNLPVPDFIIGAGHRTHWPMLCARRAFGGKAIALMSPSLPCAFFDLVVAPAHDGLTGRNVIVTQGVLNVMQPGEKAPGKTLVMVGGESKHFAWSNEQVLLQLKELATRYPALCVTDSRRTPAALRSELASFFTDRYMPWEKCPTGWLANELAGAENAWVTEDSVSMIYEALSAGCRIGLLGLSEAKGRLAQGIVSLREAKRVVRWLPSTAMPELLLTTQALAESDRVAHALLGAVRA